MKTLEKQKQQIATRKKELQDKEKRIREKELQNQKKRYIEIGRLAYKAKIDHIDESSLLGAFLEIAEKSSLAEVLQQWKKKSTKIPNSATQNTPLSIKFTISPSVEIKAILKAQKFRWHSFRGEYYGNGNQGEIEKLLKGIPCKIEVLS